MNNNKHKNIADIQRPGGLSWQR